MAKPSHALHEEEEEEEQTIIQNLAREKDPIWDLTYYLYQGFWVPSIVIRAVISLQKHFLARDDDILLASCPKSGTTWLKALSFSIVNRRRFSDISDSPLTSSNPHDFVPNLEFDVYADQKSIVGDVEALPRPRLLCTHVAYESLPVSVKSSKCKIVYVWRNPMDQAVSLWHFLRALDLQPNDTSSSQSEEAEEEFFESFCRGVHMFGPFWDHVLGFWKASLNNPEKFFLIRYEDLKKDTQCEVKKLAGFLGFPFSEKEEREGVVKKICQACSIEKMKSYKGNSEGVRLSGAPNTSYFRKGEVGDWMNQMSPILAQKMQRIIQQKFELSDLKV